MSNFCPNLTAMLFTQLNDLKWWIQPTAYNADLDASGSDDSHSHNAAVKFRRSRTKS